jgi:predicted nuclease with TOPRIM domain
MTNISLQRFDHDGIEVIIDTQTGESFASISGLIAKFQVKSEAIETNKQLESQVAKLTAKIDELDYREVDYIDEILGLKDRIKEIESKNSTLEEQIELMGGY